MNTEKLVLRFFDEGVVKFGTFTLKSGLVSPFYLDLRQTISSPDLLSGITSTLAEKIPDLDFDTVTGVPYAALPFATLLAATLNKPLILFRKEEKTYGAGGILVGKAIPGARCLILDDLVTTGESKLEIAKRVEQAGMKVAGFLVLIDRSKRASEDLFNWGYPLTSLIASEELFDILVRHGKITEEQRRDSLEYIQQEQTLLDNLASEKAGSCRENPSLEIPPASKDSYKPAAKADAGREEGGKEKEKIHPLTARVEKIMREKETRLILSLDVNTQKEFFRILESTADSLAMVKTHVDILRDFTPGFIERLKELSKKRGFLILEDRKFADIGNTVRHQFTEGIYRISSWADAVTVHLLPGESILDGLFGTPQVHGEDPKGAFLLARMSSTGNLITEEYTEKVLSTALQRRETVPGIIGYGQDPLDLRRLKERLFPGGLMLVPGVSLERGKDNLGQRYLAAEEAVEGGADLIIVGRSIIASQDPQKVAEEFRRRSWL